MSVDQLNACSIARRNILLLACMFFGWLLVPVQAQQRTEVELTKYDSTTDCRSLKGAVGNRFKMGVGVGHGLLLDPENAQLIVQHFQILTPENCMKPQAIHPAEHEWDFGPTDRFVDFARHNDLEVVGHCLLWAKVDRTDQWMIKENGDAVSRATLLHSISA